MSPPIRPAGLRCYDRAPLDLGPTHVCTLGQKHHAEHHRCPCGVTWEQTA